MKSFVSSQPELAVFCDIESSMLACVAEFCDLVAKFIGDFNVKMRKSKIQNRKIKVRLLTEC